MSDSIDDSIARIMRLLDDGIEQDFAETDRLQDKLKEAMQRYGFTHADMGHTDASCWCKPEVRCVQCAPCACSCGAPTSILHRSAS